MIATATDRKNNTQYGSVFPGQLGIEKGDIFLQSSRYRSTIVQCSDGARLSGKTICGVDPGHCLSSRYYLFSSQRAPRSMHTNPARWRHQRGDGEWRERERGGQRCQFHLDAPEINSSESGANSRSRVIVSGNQNESRPAMLMDKTNTMGIRSLGEVPPPS